MIYLIKAHLNLFDGEGAVASSGEGGANGNPAPAQQETGDNVVYGKLPPDHEESPAAEDEPTEEERRKAYDDFIAANKDFYQADTQKIINRRFKETKAMQSQLESHQDILDKLSARYGIEDGDISKIADAIDHDDLYLSARAERDDRTVEEAREDEQRRLETYQLRRAQDTWQRASAARMQMDMWRQEAEAVKAVYPEFDLNAESNDPGFVSLLKAGVKMEDAYATRHMGEIMAKAQAAAAKRVTDDIKAQGRRPRESATSSGSAFTVKSDPSQWSDEEFDKVMRDVAMGKKVYL